MYEDDIFPPDQEGIFKGYLACLQGINLNTSTTEDDVFMGGTWLLPVQWCPWHLEHLTGQRSAEVDSKIFQVIVVKVCVFGIWSKQHNNLLTFKLFCNVYDGPKNKLNAYSAWWWILLSKQVKKIPDIFFHQGNFDHHVMLWDFGCKFRPHQWWSTFGVIHH